MCVANDASIMGERVNGRLVNLLGWTTTALMFGAAVALIVEWIRAG
jgi:Mn2+/Fe2+ NRAMP family transporter